MGEMNSFAVAEIGGSMLGKVLKIVKPDLSDKQLAEFFMRVNRTRFDEVFDIYLFATNELRAICIEILEEMGGGSRWKRIRARPSASCSMLSAA